MDPLMGIVGALVIAHWSGSCWSALPAASCSTPSPIAELVALVRRRLEVEGDRIADLHLWRLGPGHPPLIVAVVSDRPKPPEAYKARLDGLAGLSHLTVEVHPCCSHAPLHQAA